MAPRWLPPDVLLEILTRLPAKTLARFKCVSKSWRDLISAPYFVRSHLRRSDSDPTSHSILVRIPVDSDRVELKAFDPSTLDQIPPLGGATYPRILNTCNGLACMRSPLRLWNPTTRELRVVPPCLHHDLSDVHSVVFGCGSTDPLDCKVVAIGLTGGATWAEVWSMSSGSWREIDLGGMIFTPAEPPSQQAVTKGIAYWTIEDGAHERQCFTVMGRGRARVATLCLDAAESFRFFSVPDDCPPVGSWGDPIICRGLIWDGHFALLVFDRLTTYEIWWMNDNECGWKKERFQPGLQHMVGYMVVTLRDGRFLLYSTVTQVVLWDIRAQKRKQVFRLEDLTKGMLTFTAEYRVETLL